MKQKQARAALQERSVLAGMKQVVERKLGVKQAAGRKLGKIKDIRSNQKEKSNQ